MFRGRRGRKDEWSSFAVEVEVAKIKTEKQTPGSLLPTHVLVHGSVGAEASDARAEVGSVLGPAGLRRRAAAACVRVGYAWVLRHTLVDRAGAGAAERSRARRAGDRRHCGPSWTVEFGGTGEDFGRVGVGVVDVRALDFDFFVRRKRYFH